MNRIPLVSRLPRRPRLSWRGARRFGLWTVAVLAVLALVFSGLSVWAVRRSFPKYGGDLRLPGLSAPVTVHRDEHGIPQVYAATADDLFRAQGYLHAQDRFWEMDFRRHVTAGRLAELFGESQLETDAYLRTMGWRRVAEQELPILAPQTRQYLQSYADGVNAWLSDHDGGTASLEYTVLGLQNPGYTIEKWSPADSLAWLKAMAWDLRGNMETEIARAALLADGLTRQQVEELYPGYPYERNAPIVSGGGIVAGAFNPKAAPPPPKAPATAGTTGSTSGTGGSTTGAVGGGMGGGVTGGMGGGIVARSGGTAGVVTGLGDANAAGVSRLGRPAVQAMANGLARLPMLLGNGGPGIGSNSWVLGGALTTSGKPILANDPHLSPTMPGIWYQMGLHCECGYQVAGFTFSGLPGVIIGHNARITWGFTNLNPDVTDLYLERVDGDRVQVDGEWTPLQTRQETIKVAGGRDRAITIRSSQHGPLLSDVSETLRDIGARPPVDPAGSPVPVATQPASAAPTTSQPPSAAPTTGQPASVAPTTGQPAGTAGAGAGRRGGYAIALSWTALHPGHTADALFALDSAGNWAEFRAAAEKFEVPAQNLIYADVDGNIGYQAPGKIPVRGKGDGRWMAPGWDSGYDWQGFIPFAELPNVLNPADGFVVTANHAVIGPGYQRMLTTDWSYGYRSQRIRDMITSARAAGKISVDDVQRMQFDNRNGFAPTLVPAVRAALQPADPADAARATADQLFQRWDFQQPADGKTGTAAGDSSAAAAFYNALWRHLLADTFDELPADYRPDGGDRWYEVVRGLLDRPDSPWWDRRGTPTVEHRDDILRAAAAEAAAELRHDQGDRPADWRWGRMHTLTVTNQSFGKSGIGVVEWLFNADEVAVSGGDDIVNATGWNAATGYQVDSVPSMRMIVDLSDLDACRWVQLTGNSGHAFHRDYDDQFELWRTGRTLPMRWDRATIAKDAQYTLTFRP